MRCWKVAQEYLDAFSNLGPSYEVSLELFKKFEKFSLQYKRGRY